MATQTVPVFEDKLDSFVHHRTNSFSMEEITNTMLHDFPHESSEQIQKEIRAIFDADCSVFEKKEEPNIFYSRQQFFLNQSFQIALTELEQKHKILIPGARFAPFCHDSILPSEIKLFIDGKKVPSTIIQMSIEEAASYFALLGAEEMIHYFDADHIDNPPIIASGDPLKKIKLSVFNLSKFSDSHKFQITVRDWYNGKFDLLPINSKSTTQKPSWSPLCDQALCQVFDQFGYFINIPEQIAQALFIQPEILHSQDFFELDRLLPSSELIEIILLGSRTILWRNDEERPADEKSDVPQDFSLSNSPTNDIDEILCDIDCPVSSIEIEANIRQELQTGNQDMHSILHKIFDPWQLHFKDDVQETFFYNHFEALWEDLSETYDPVADQYKAAVREIALHASRMRLHFLARIQTLEHLSKKQLEILKQIDHITEVILKLLQTINSELPIENEEESNNLIQAASDISDQLHSLIRQFELTHN